MKSYHVLECANQKQIANELHLFLLKENGVLEKDNLKFWNFLNKKDLFNCLKECKALRNNIWLGLGWLCVVAQCYSYSWNKIELEYVSK